ncbi:MAG TPA: outer membrane beta-barrel protein [Vicinamibacterales bacterium]|nr:outer membrane beta-barrel protein [Vicinamibacterales bacterium]
MSAQETAPADPIESMPIRLGPLGLSPTFSLTNFGIDSNVFNDPANPQSDFTLTATPKVVARLRSSRLLMTGGLATGLVYYQKFDDERSIDYATDGRVDLDLGAFRPYASARRLDTKDRLNAELDLRTPRISVNLAAGARVLATSRTGFRMEARRASVTFDEASIFEGVPLSETLNSETTTFEGGLELYLTPLTTLSVMASRQEDRFDQSPERDAASYKVMPTLKFEPPAILQGTLGVGYRRFNGLAAAMPDFSGVVFEGGLTHIFVERTKLDVGVFRDVQYSFEVEEPYYVTTGVRATITHQVRDALDMRGTVSRDRLDYRSQQPDERRDTLTLVSAGTGYRFSPNLRIGVDLEFARRLSDRADRDYDRVRLLGSAAYGF